MMAVVKVKRNGVLHDTDLSGIVRVGGVSTPFGPVDPGVPNEFYFNPAVEPFDETDSTEPGTVITLGTVIRTNVAGTVRVGRWRFPDAMHPGATVDFVLYDNITESEVRRATFVAPVLGEWNQVPIDPYPTVANQILIAAICEKSPGGTLHYVFRGNYFDIEKTNGNLSGLADVANGRFLTGDAFPTLSFNRASYYVDFGFRPN